MSHIKNQLYISSIIKKQTLKTKTKMENQTKPKLDLDWFEDMLMMFEMDVEGEIDNFDACDDHHWYQMRDRAFEMTYDYFMKLGYTKDEIDEITEER